MTKEYDYLIVGAGLYGSAFAYKANRMGKKCLVIDKRPHTGGNIFCETVVDIRVHTYGPHIFHTSNKQVWDFVNTLVGFNHFILSPIANYK
jgi:UDP-galactopyranose mutase